MPPSLPPVLALTSLTTGAFALAAVPLIKSRKALRWAFPLSLLSAGGAIAASALWIHGLSLHPTASTERFSVLLRASPLTAWWFLAISVLIWMGLVITAYQTERATDRLRRFFLLLLSGIGALSLAGAGHLLVALAAWQLIALPLTLASMQQAPLPGRAQSLVSVYLADFFSFVLMALGLAFIFAQCQTLSLDLLLESIQAESQTSDILLYTGTALWLAGVLVRLGGVPFHMVVSERVQAGNAAVSGFASVFLAFSAASFLWSFAGEVLRPTLPQWQVFLSLLGLTTVWVGSLGMLVRPQWRSLVSYALVAQAGWVLMALASRGPISLESESFYSLWVSSAALLLVLFGNLVLDRNGGKRGDDSAVGLLRSRGPLAFILLTGLLTVAGLPPTAGFAARAMLLARVASDGQPLLAILGALATVVAAYPCLVWAKRILAPGGTSGEWPFPAKLEIGMLWLFALGLWVVGIWPVIVWPG